MDLVIVESPTKAKTIKRFLGNNFIVKSSYGHIRDLPKGDLGVDVENNFKPKYVIPPKARKIISELKTTLQKSDSAILATDEDREGEAIAWHLSEVLGMKEPQRIVFHEITKPAIEEALKNPGEINLNLVDSQQARRILDRLVGYKLSPFLWKKVAKGLSAGRVQSVAVRLVAEREREIENFKAREYWEITARLQSRIDTNEKQINTDNKSFLAKLVKKNGKVIDKLEIKNKKEADKIVEDLNDAEYQVEKIEKKETKRNPLPPFTTSTLQQESWKRFKFPSRLTMALAQQLYEKGQITYHRTDSLNLSQLSLLGAKKFIEENFGKEYWPGFFRKYKAKGKVQEAHEAIRPTSSSRKPEDLKLEKNQQKLYRLVWQRFIASQMASALFDATSVDIEAMKELSSFIFRASGQILKFEGFLKVYPLKFEETDLPELEKNEILELLELIPSRHFTQPPARYSEATLIRALEENGIGRPSTYAPILSTIQGRNYIEKNQQKKFQPTEIGLIVNDLLVKHFPEIVDFKFTANMENDLDKIAEGERKWTKVCNDFYRPFEKNLREKYQEVDKKEISVQKTDKKCPKCGSDLVIRLGRFGKFYACSAFPKCRYTEPLEKKTLGIKCPKCGQGEIVEKRTRKGLPAGRQGKIFYGCNQFPKCDFALWDKPINENCPECGSLLAEKNKKIKCSNKDCQFKKSVAE